MCAGRSGGAGFGANSNEERLRSVDCPENENKLLELLHNKKCVQNDFYSAHIVKLGFYLRLSPFSSPLHSVCPHSSYEMVNNTTI